MHHKRMKDMGVKSNVGKGDVKKEEEEEEE